MISKFQKVVNFLYRRFVQEMGREPATTKEIMDIQDEAVRHFNKTKGVPQGAPKPSFQGFKPTVIEGGKSKEGIGTLLEDSPEAIAKMKADNKAAIKRLQEKKKTVEDFSDDGDFDPGGMASGGTARVGYADGTREKTEKAILSTPPNVGGIIGDIGSLYVQGLPKWLISKLMQGGVRSNLAKKYNRLAKENRLRDARQLLTDDNPYMGEDPSISSAKRIMREVPTAPSKSRWEIKQSLNQGGIARVGYAGGRLVFEGLKKFLQNKKTVRKAVDDIFPTGDYKYDAEMAAEALVENNPKFFKNKLYDDLSDADRMEVYGSVLSEVQNDLAKMLQTRRLSKPTKTLEGLEREGTIDISNPEVADEFSRFMGESDPKGYKDLEQKIELSNLDIKGKKGHASGGRAGRGLNYLLGEDDQNVRMPSGGLPGLLGE